MSNRIVVWDPSGRFWDGAIVSEFDEARMAGNGCVTLPCNAEEFGLAGNSAFSKRSWGSGWPLPVSGAHFAPLAVFKAGEGSKVIHWAARLVADDATLARARAGKQTSHGALQIAGAQSRSGQDTPSIYGQGGVDLSKLGPPDENDGWNLKGTASFSSPHEGTYGVCLYGYGPGMRVQWLAVSLTP